MTIAEARRLLGVENNYQLAKLMDWHESTISRWKTKNGRLPDSWANKVRARAGVKK